MRSCLVHSKKREVLASAHAVEDDAPNCPEHADGGDRNRARDGNPRAEPRLFAEPADGDECQCDDKQLTEVDAEVEAQECNEKVALRKGDVAKAAGEAETMDEA